MEKNWTMHAADRGTHLKIVVLSLVAATLITAFGIAVRDLNLGTDILTARGPTVYQPGNATVFTSRDASTIR